MITVDPGIVAESAKGVTYVVGLAIVALWNERKRSRGSAKHEKSLDEKLQDIKDSFSTECSTISDALTQHRFETAEKLGNLKEQITTIGTVVGVDSENGLRGIMKGLVTDVKMLQRDVLGNRRHDDSQRESKS